MNLQSALDNPIFQQHKIGALYSIKGDSRLWKLTYYPIFQNGKNGDYYDEPRVLVETPILNGIEFREMPIHFLTKL